MAKWINLTFKKAVDVMDREDEEIILRWAREIKAKRAKNTWSRGEDNPQAKLTKREVAKIRRRPDIKIAAFARIYGVDRTTIQRIRRGATWVAEPPR